MVYQVYQISVLVHFFVRRCHDDDEERKDKLELFDGGTVNSASLGVFCGSDRGDSVVSSGNLLTAMYLQNGAAGEYLGFRATFKLGA